MWLMKKGCESVNLDYVQSIEKISDDNDEDYRIVFYQTHDNEVNFDFDSKSKLNEYYEALMFQLAAIEINPVKL